jgi:hypothetical protein
MAGQPAKPAVPADPALNLAPEVGAAVRQAEEALMQAEADARRAQDPSAEMFAALRVTLGAMHKLTVDGVLTMQAGLAAIEKVKAPLTADEIQRLNAAAANAAAVSQWKVTNHLIDRAYWRHVLLVGIGAAVALGIGIASAWGWYTAPTLRCEAANGGTFCGYWAAPPTK